MAAASKHPALKLNVEYDRDTDVLYAALGAPRPAEGKDGPGGIVYRYALEGDAPCGLTIIGFRRNGWHGKLNDLAVLISDHLHIEPEQVKILLRGSSATA